MSRLLRHTRAMFSQSAFALAIAATLTAALTACSGGGDGTTPPATPSVVSVAISAPSSTVLVGDQVQLTANVTVLNGASTAVTWSSSDVSIATVSASGLVQGVAPGAVTITAKSTADATKSATQAMTVSARPAVSAVSVTPVNASISVGGTQALTVNVTAVGGASTAVSWASSNPTIATVNGAGIVTGVAGGSANITATSAFDATKSAFSVITVVATPAVTSVAITPLTAPVVVGTPVQLNATVTVINGASQALTWSSSNNAVATVSQSGVLTGVSAGNVTITATSVFDNTKSSNIQATITQPAGSVTSVVVTPAAPAAINVGGSVALTATVTALNGASTAVNWTTSNPSVATVAPTGTVTGVGVGSATITATSVFDASKSGTASITVNAVPAVQSVALGNVPAALIVNTTAQLFATVSTTGGASDAVSWTSSDPTLASVSSSGLVTALAPGSVTITARSVFDPTKAATSSSIRLDAAAIVISVSVGPASLSLTVGQNGQLTATVQVGNNASTAVTWTSDNTSVATVNGTGRVTAVSAGSARIRATSQADATKFAESMATITAAGFPSAATVNATVFSQFTPQTIDISAFGTVTWAFAGLGHNVTFDDPGAPNDIPTSSNANINRTFPTAGTYNYHCTIHGGMTGIVRVH